MVGEREKRIILLVASLSSFLVPFTGSSITVAIPAMASQFHADAVTLGWIASAYIIAAAVFIVPFGRLADIRGRKKIFILGVAIFTIASLACAFAPTEKLLIAPLFIQGIGCAMLFATSVAIVTQVYDPGERGGGARDHDCIRLCRALPRPVHRRFLNRPLRLAGNFPHQCSAGYS
jgi:MFS family permease